MNRRSFLSTTITFSAIAALSKSSPASAPPLNNAGSTQAGSASLGKVTKTNAEWKRILTPAQYRVTRQGGTETPYSSPLNKVKGNGTYQCVCCALPLFSSKTKFESNTGWPSFWAPINKRHVRQAVDNSASETRTEVLCARCDAHLGHVFDDGPKPTGLRYCMNGVALKFARNG